MILYCLSGNSIANKAWIEEAASRFSDLFTATYVHQYKHWQTGEPMADIEYEIASLRASLPIDQPYIVLAKSVGTIIALRAHQQGILHPAGAMLLGIPLNLTPVLTMQLQDAITPLSAHTTIIQNTHDPVGSFQEIAQQVASVPDSVSVLEYPGSTHDYTAYTAMRKVLIRTIQRAQ